MRSKNCLALSCMPAPLGKSSGGNNLSSDGNEPSSGGKSIEKVKKSKRVNPEIMKQAILELCQTPKTLQENVTTCLLCFLPAY